MIFLQILLALSSLSLTAPGATPANDEKGRTKVLMHTFLIELDKMAPYLNSDKALESQKAREIVGSSLKVMESKLRHPPTALQDSPGFRISFGMFADHIEKTKQAFDRGELDHTRIRLNSTTALCAACHMQTPQMSRLSPFSTMEERFKSVNFDNANFLFVIRRFPEALAMYDELARQYPKSSVSSDQLAELYRRKLTIFGRVTRDPNAAIKNLRADLKNKNLPIDVRSNINDWISSLEKWKGEKKDPSKMNTADLVTYAAKSLPSNLNRKIAPSDPQLLNILRVSGLLYERLFSEPSSEKTQELLYYLALCERSLAPMYFYSVSEIYLKECIVRYPQRPFSQKCYDAYADGMRERYFGKMPPEGVTQSLEALKKYL